MGKTRPTKINGNSTYGGQRESVNTGIYPHKRSNFSKMERQRDSYANRVRGPRSNVPKSIPAGNQMGSVSDNKLFSLVKLLKEIMNSD